MPRAFTEEEAARLRARLIAVGRERFGRFGVAKTTIGELAADAGIGKGSFYLFFPSKEALFFAVQSEDERAFKEGLLAEAAALRDPARRLEALLRGAAERLHRHPILRQVTDPATLAALQARVDPAALQAHEAADRAFFLELARRWRAEGTLRPDLDDELLFDLLMAMFALAMQRDLLGEARLQRVVGFLSGALAAALAGPGAPPG